MGLFYEEGLKTKDHMARDLHQKYCEPSNYPIMVVILPLLKELRTITLSFQFHKGDNYKVFKELQNYFEKLAKRIVRGAILREHFPRPTLFS